VRGVELPGCLLGWRRGEGGAGRSSQAVCLQLRQLKDAAADGHYSADVPLCPTATAFTT